MSPEELSARFPRVFHVAEANSWQSIRRHGLLSTSALLDLFEIRGAKREAIESRRRPDSVKLRHPQHGTAVIRDQKPMDDRGLKRALQDGITPQEWYVLLNQHVFFWVSEERLVRLLGARAYRERRQVVLTVSTPRLLDRHADRIVLSPMNSGATKPMPHPRGRYTFLPIRDYPFAEWNRKRRGRDAIVELAVKGGVPDIRDLVKRVTLVGGGEPEVTIWPSG